MDKLGLQFFYLATLAPMTIWLVRHLLILNWNPTNFLAKTSGGIFCSIYASIFKLSGDNLFTSYPLG